MVLTVRKGGYDTGKGDSGKLFSSGWRARKSTNRLKIVRFASGRWRKVPAGRESV